MNKFIRLLGVAAIMAAIVSTFFVTAPASAGQNYVPQGTAVVYCNNGATTTAVAGDPSWDPTPPFFADRGGWFVDWSQAPAGITEGACVIPPHDSDGDGVIDELDNCADTSPNTAVDEHGCPIVLPPVDSDGDGVSDDIDLCAGTLAGTQVDSVGCPPPSLEELPEGEWVRNDILPQGDPPTCLTPITQMLFPWKRPVYDRWELQAGQWVPAGSGIQYEYFPEEVRLSDAEVQACRPQDVEIPGTWQADDPTDCSAMLSMWMTVTVVAPVLNQTTLIWEPGNVADGTPKVRVQFGPREDAGLAPCETGTPTVTPTVDPSPTPGDPDPTPTETPPPGPTLPPGGGGNLTPTATATQPPDPTQIPDSGSGSNGGGNPPNIGGLPNTGTVGPHRDDGLTVSMIVLAGGLVFLTGAVALRQRRHSA